MNGSQGVDEHPHWGGPEPKPHWPDAVVQWAWAWPMHYLSLAALHLLLVSMVTLLGFTMRRRLGGQQGCPAVGALAIGAALSTSQSLTLLLDPYGSRCLLPGLLLQLLNAWVAPCLTAMFTLVQISIRTHVETLKGNRTAATSPSRRRQCHLVAAGVLAHFTLVAFVVGSVSAHRHIAPLLLLNHIVFITWQLVVCFLLVYSCIKMARLTARTRELSEEIAQYSRLRKKGKASGGNGLGLALHRISRPRLGVGHRAANADTGYASHTDTNSSGSDRSFFNEAFLEFDKEDSDMIRFYKDFPGMTDIIPREAHPSGSRAGARRAREAGRRGASGGSDSDSGGVSDRAVTPGRTTRRRAPCRQRARQLGSDISSDEESVDNSRDESKSGPARKESCDIVSTSGHSASSRLCLLPLISTTSSDNIGDSTGKRDRSASMLHEQCCSNPAFHASDLSISHGDEWTRPLRGGGGGSGGSGRGATGRGPLTHGGRMAELPEEPSDTEGGYLADIEPTSPTTKHKRQLVGDPAVPCGKASPADTADNGVRSCGEELAPGHFPLPAAEGSLGIRRIRQAVGLGRVVRWAYFAVACAAVNVGLHVYAMFGTHGVLGGNRDAEPWPWFAYHTVSSLAELSAEWTMVRIIYLLCQRKSRGRNIRARASPLRNS